MAEGALGKFDSCRQIGELKTIINHSTKIAYIVFIILTVVKLFKHKLNFIPAVCVVSISSVKKTVHSFVERWNAQFFLTTGHSIFRVLD